MMSVKLSSVTSSMAIGGSLAKAASASNPSGHLNHIRGESGCGSILFHPLFFHTHRGLGLLDKSLSLRIEECQIDSDIARLWN
jgi:hypothetical protein